MELLSSYIYIPVSDLVRSRDWYCETLGLHVYREDPLFVELRASAIRVMLITNGDGINSQMLYPSGPQASYGFTTSEAIDQVYQKLANRGIEVRSISTYAGKSFGFLDPDGNLLELWSDWPSNSYED